MLGATMIDWTQVLVTGVPATIAALCSGFALVIVALNRRTLRTPSGDPIGHVVERTHDLAAVSVKSLHKINGAAVDAAEAEPADA